MCIVIDANCLSSVFNTSSHDHSSFQPVLNWIINGRGKVVYGGTKYLNEASKYIRFLNELSRAGKGVSLPSDPIDKEELIVAAKVNHPDFDDQHLVALLRISKCKLICSKDERAYDYFRHGLFFQTARDRPRIYHSLANINLLSPINIAPVCLPSPRTTNSQRDLFSFI